MPLIGGYIVRISQVIASPRQIDFLFKICLSNMGKYHRKTFVVHVIWIFQEILSRKGEFPEKFELVKPWSENHSISLFWPGNRVPAIGLLHNDRLIKTTRIAFSVYTNFGFVLGVLDLVEIVTYIVKKAWNVTNHVFDHVSTSLKGQWPHVLDKWRHSTHACCVFFFVNLVFFWPCWPGFRLSRGSSPSLVMVSFLFAFFLQ